MCLNIQGNSSAQGTPVVLATCDSSASGQKWTTWSDGTFRANGKCLDMKGNTPGSIVQLWECNGLGFQWWVPRDDGSMYNPTSGLCLTDAKEMFLRETPSAPAPEGVSRHSLLTPHARALVLAAPGEWPQSLDQPRTHPPTCRRHRTRCPVGSRNRPVTHAQWGEAHPYRMRVGAGSGPPPALPVLT